MNLNQTAEVCNNLVVNKAVQTSVQTIADNISMYNNVLASVPGVLLCLFIGPWSDTHGRRLLLVLPMLGSAITQVCINHTRAIPLVT